MWHLSVPWWELVLRAGAVYLFVILALRLTGKRQVSQLSPFDFVLLLILGNAVQNSMNGGDNSLVGGLILASVLICLNWIVGYFNFRNYRARRLFEGRPEVLVHKGHVFEKMLAREKISMSEFHAILRKNGLAGPEEAKLVMLEANGDISVIKKGS